MIIDFIKSSWKELFLMCIVILISLFGIKVFVIEKIKKVRRCTVKVKGTIKRIKNDWDYYGKRRTRVKKAICTYSYNGSSYESEIDEYMGLCCEKKGDEYEFYINPNKPYETSKLQFLDAVRIAVQGISFIVVLFFCVMASKSMWDNYIVEKRVEENRNKRILALAEAEQENANKESYLYNGVTIRFGKEYMVNDKNSKLFTAERYDKKTKFCMVVNFSGLNKDEELNKMKTYMEKKYPKAKIMREDTYKDNVYVVYKEEVDSNCYIKYVISNNNRKIFIKYICKDAKYDELESILKTIIN